MTTPTRHRGWHSRGYLPHFDELGLVQSISYRLHDSVPAEVIDEWKEELKWSKGLPSTHPSIVELRRRLSKYEDLSQGQCWLRQAEVAQLVQNSFLHFHEQRYILLAWCVMPNHVHVMIEVRERRALEGIVQSWKAFTAREANRILGRSGTFWMPDYFDRYMRNDRHYYNTITYIEENPCAALLVSSREEWPWSSATWQPEQ